MKQTKLLTILAIIYVSFVLGLLGGMLFQKIDSILLIFVLIAVPGVLTICVVLFMRMSEKRHIQKNVDIMSHKITLQTEDGYELNPADLYDAIEKLGYLEHEWKGEKL